MQDSPYLTQTESFGGDFSCKNADFSHNSVRLNESFEGDCFVVVVKWQDLPQLTQAENLEGDCFLVKVQDFRQLGETESFEGDWWFFW